MRLPEQNGMLYLGGRVDGNGEPLADAPLLYDARDLTTHAVCLGMTGSGKTGLGVGLIEEVALSGIPALVIDPKGDMTNLMLAFPDLLPEDLKPWVDIEAARRRDLSIDEYAQHVAESWRKGLAQWGIDGARIARFRDSVETVIYTPGSDAGRSLSIVESLHAPPLDWDRDAGILRERISSTVSAILALVGIESDPVSGREHILMAAILERVWRSGQDVDLGRLILEVQKPPFDHLGVLPLEVFYPEKDRMKLALALNGLLASPSFAAWMQGDPLSAGALLRAADGRPRISIFTLAHLQDAERFFFVTLLLEQVRSWLRVQEGTPNLRALLYFDELYGFMPPYPANPPTKELLLTLLKQARSQGMGLVLATQNPVDLDYKGLSNAGTWFIGKLQTANDRERVLEGLRGASLEVGVSVEGTSLGDLIAGLQPRTFLMHNVHGDAPVLFRTRHVMSYLRGPLTRVQIQELTRGGARPGQRTAAEQPTLPAQSVTVATPDIVPEKVQEPPATAGLPTRAPLLPSGVRQFFLPVQVPLEWAIRKAEASGRMIIYQQQLLVYRPALYGRAAVRIESAKHDVSEKLTVSRVIPVPEDDPFVAWHTEPIATTLEQLDERPAQGARFGSLPVLLGDAKRLRAVEREFADFVYREVSLTLSYHPELKLTARPDEPAGEFRRRCADALRERRDAEIEKLEKSYQTKVDRLQDRIRREERELDQDETEFEARKREELLSAGESVLNLLTRRRQSRMLSTASRKRRMTQRAKADLSDSKRMIEDLQDDLEDLLGELEEEIEAVKARWSETAENLDTVSLRPRKSDIYVEAWGVAWAPYWDIVYEDSGVARQLSLAAFEA